MKQIAATPLQYFIKETGVVEVVINYGNNHPESFHHLPSLMEAGKSFVSCFESYH